MLAGVADRRNAVAVAEDRDPLAGDADDPRPLVLDVGDGTGVEIAVDQIAPVRIVSGFLAKAGDQMQGHDPAEAADQQPDQHQIAFALQDPQGHVEHQ